MALLLLAVLAAFAPSLQRPGDVVKWSASAPAKAVVAGGDARIALTANVEAGWKLYALTQPKGGPRPLSIVAAKGSGVTLDPGKIVSPRPKTLADENFKLETLYYEDEAAFTVPVRIPKTMSGGPLLLPLEMTFQACGASICLRPFTQRVSVEIIVVRKRSTSFFQNCDLTCMINVVLDDAVEQLVVGDADAEGAVAIIGRGFEEPGLGQLANG